MRATELVRNRVVFSETAFADIVLLHVPKPVAGSTHGFKYRLAYVVKNACVVLYDNESGKGDHRHFKGKETPCIFHTPQRLIADFQRDIERWNHENRNS